jgi:alkanesulfonate monooxygenase SsuD/methylene tetrahydromethanopterin reductase-like flavin-dependent oxidoreductase (luciferase family)
MAQLDLLLPEGKIGNYEIHDTIELAKTAEEAGFQTVWKGESYSTNSFMNLSSIATATETINLGTAITNVFSRPPALIAMSAATLDMLSNGRTVLGLGVSTEAVIESWYGQSYERPLRRTRELIEVLRAMFAEETVEYDGQIFTVGPYPVGFDIDRDSIPIYNAAMGPTNCRLTGEYADGWLPVYTPPETIRTLYEEEVLRGVENADRDPTDVSVTPLVTTSVAETTATAREQARRSLAQAMAVGYNGLVSQFGFEDGPDEAAAHWREGNRDAAAAAISDEMVDELTVAGTPEECRQQLQELQEQTRADTVAVMPPYTATPSDVESMLSALEPIT